MKKFTKCSAKANKYVANELKIISNFLIHKFNPLSIILVGGFGRGEGGVIIAEKNIIPVNDYDLYIITYKKISSNELENTSLDVCRKLRKKGITFNGFDKKYTLKETFYPDIRSLTVKQLKTLPPLAKYYEMKNSGYILYGQDLLKTIPHIRISDIPTSEGFRFLMNRFCLQAAFFSKDKKYKEGLINFTTKTVLSCAEILLLLSKKYESSYEKRALVLAKTYAKDFPELAKELPGLFNLVNKYTDYKLFPLDRKVKNIGSDWFKARDSAFTVLKFYIKRYSWENVDSPKSVAKFIDRLFWRDYIKGYWKIFSRLPYFLLFLGGVYMNLLFFIRVLRKTGKIYLWPIYRFWVPPELKIYAAAVLFMFSHNPDGKIVAKNLELARRYLKEVFPVNSRGTDSKGFEDFRQEFGDAYSLYEHLKVA